MVLDFNRTINMWFAFTDRATCPMPVTGNTITPPSAQERNHTDTSNNKALVGNPDTTRSFTLSFTMVYRYCGWLDGSRKRRFGGLGHRIRTVA